MKRIKWTFAVILASAGIAFANKYEKAMSQAINELYDSNDLQDYLDVSAKFERIGATETQQWLPMYYAGLSYIWATHGLQDAQAIDEYLDKSQIFVDKASKLSPNNDEILTLQGYIYMIKVAVDPSNRGPELSGIALQTFGRAIGINKSNPRATMLMGRMQMGTDQFFGNDISESCGMILKAIKLFQSQTPDNRLSPSWGLRIAQEFLKECSSN